jgi:putative flippase GtrA
MNQVTSTPARILRFYVVGGIGVAVQLAVLGTLTHGFGVNYVLATIAGVETAIIHNFLWHDRWTWGCRIYANPTRESRLRRFWKFNGSTGVIAIVTNAIMTPILVELAGISPMVANLIAIASGSAATFLASNNFVFAGKEVSEP